MSNSGMIDLDHLEKYVAGDAGLRDEILSIFAEQVEALVAKLSSAQTDEGWRNAAHALKGAARGVGAWALGDLAEEAEAAIGPMPGKAERRAGFLLVFRKQANAALEEVKRLRALAA
ncbi:MAG: Hpt domain-containing protein [Pseudomonadota bacterium]